MSFFFHTIHLGSHHDKNHQMGMEEIITKGNAEKVAAENSIMEVAIIKDTTITMVAISESIVAHPIVIGTMC